MGFRLDRTYTLQFEGNMSGAYVKLKSTPVGVSVRLRTSISVKEAVELLTRYLDEWNLEDADGKTVPFTVEAIMENVEEVVIAKILVEWYRAAAGITAPLDPPGADGTLTDLDIPMAS
jgi:hypothetical protein